MNLKQTIRYALAASPLLLAYSGGTYAEDCDDPCTVSGASVPEILLVDDTANAISWEIESDDDGDVLQIGILGGVTEPFRIENGAGEDSLHVDSTGRVGIGTGSPIEELQIDSVLPGIRLNDTNGGQADVMLNFNSLIIEGNTSQDIVNVDTTAPAASVTVDDEGNVGLGTLFTDWNLALAGDGSIFMENGNDDWLVTNGTTGLWFGNGAGPAAANGKVKFNNQAPENSLVVEGFGSGDIGMGTATPDASLEVTRSDGTAQVLVEETNGTAVVRRLFKLANNGDPSFEFEDTSSGARTEFRLNGAADSFAINHIGGTTAGAELRLERDGDLFILGALDAAGGVASSVALTQSSDIAAKTAIVAVMPEDILEKIQALPISSWQYKADNPGVRHVGPMAQDFRAAFGLGKNDTTIAPSDMAGVALAAIQAQQQRMAQKDEQIAALQARLSAIEASLTK